MSYRCLGRRATLVLVAAAASATGCGDAKPAPGIVLEAHTIPKGCNEGENFGCWGSSRPNAAPGPDGLVLVVWLGTYAPTEHNVWGRFVDAASRRPVGRLMKMALKEEFPGQDLDIGADERGWTVQRREDATHVSPDGTQRPTRRKAGLWPNSSVTLAGPGCGGGAISVALADGPPMIIAAGEDRRMRIDPQVCGL